MIDRFGREINYMRLSITDRCNLRCRYCMPEGIVPVAHRDILTYEEILQAAGAAVELGVTKFKVTGGEPLVRLGCVDFLARLKALPGVEAVTLTTNGVLLAPEIPRLAELGIDGVNVSLDAVDRETFAAITGFDRLDRVTEGIDALLAAGIPAKVNCVLLPDSLARLVPLARLAEQKIDVRFIEVMPIGAGDAQAGPSWEQALAVLRREWPDLSPVEERRGSGPARYYASETLQGRIGSIAALSHKFCDGCNRIRLTSTGRLKPCLCYGEGADLRTVLRKRPDDLLPALRNAIWEKPAAHCFGQAGGVTEQLVMGQIGG